MNRNENYYPIYCHWMKKNDVENDPLVEYTGFKCTNKYWQRQNGNNNNAQQQQK